MTTISAIPVTDLATTTTIPTQSATEHILPSPFHNSLPPPELLTQGAEALVYRTTFLDNSVSAALKFRPSKPYRHPILDQKLTKQRVLAEARVLVKLSALRKDGVIVPAVLALEWDVARKVRHLNEEQKNVSTQARSIASESRGAWLLMEWIEGKSVKQLLRDWELWFTDASLRTDTISMPQAEDNVKQLLRRIGRAVAAMHFKGGVVHGDLTSSNIMVRPLSVMHSHATVNDESESGRGSIIDLDGEIVLIDFGLATQSVQDEDRAVDLYVLERAFGSTHPRQEGWFDAEVLQSPEGYRGAHKGANIVLKRLEEVRLRGRKRSMLG